jgi:N-acetylmuramoyl-L-alanine amidase
MPAILIETSFISNKIECERLLDPAYQDALCDAIANGIQKYVDATNPKQL